MRLYCRQQSQVEIALSNPHNPLELGQLTRSSKAFVLDASQNQIVTNPAPFMLSTSSLLSFGLVVLDAVYPMERSYRTLASIIF